MRVVNSLLNRSEELVFNELQNIASDNDLRVFSKTRLSDVIQKDSTILTQREFDFFTRSHCDFVITDANFKPMMIVEYDGPFHVDEKQKERDKIKNELCKRAEMGILRIHDQHVTKLYRGMSVLRWIVEVFELQKSFYAAQLTGQIPYEEIFDPSLIERVGENRRFPYWLSAPATQSFHSFFKTLDPTKPKGWNSVLGFDHDGTIYRLSCLYFDDQIIYSKTSVRSQGLDFPYDDLANEIDTCELGIVFKKFQTGEFNSVNIDQFKRNFDYFCSKYDVHPSHSMGSFPFEKKWDIKNIWRSP